MSAKTFTDGNISYIPEKNSAVSNFPIMKFSDVCYIRPYKHFDGKSCYRYIAMVCTPYAKLDMARYIKRLHTMEKGKMKSDIEKLLKEGNIKASIPDEFFDFVWEYINSCTPVKSNI